QAEVPGGCRYLNLRRCDGIVGRCGAGTYLDNRHGPQRGCRAAAVESRPTVDTGPDGEAMGRIQDICGEPGGASVLVPWAKQAVATAHGVSPSWSRRSAAVPERRYSSAA